MPRDAEQLLRDDRVRYQHMLNAAEHVVLFIAGRSRNDLDSDAMLVRALMNAMQEIGKAASRVSEYGRARAPSIPWAQIVAMRNVLVHVYWGVDRERLWKSAMKTSPR